MPAMTQRRMAGVTALMLLFYLIHAALYAPTANAASVEPEVLEFGNPTCGDLQGPGQTWLALKVEIHGDKIVDGTHTSSDGELTVTISATVDHTAFDWSSDIGVDGVLVKSGIAGNHFYRYDPPLEATGDTNLTTPDGPGDGVSHITFCYDLEAPQAGSAGLIVRKVVEAPAGAETPDQDFAITVDGHEAVLLADGESSTLFTYEVGAGATVQVASITEDTTALASEWTSVSVDCSNEETSDTAVIADVTLTEGATVTCTFTNVYTPPATSSSTTGVISPPTGETTPPAGEDDGAVLGTTITAAPETTVVTAPATTTDASVLGTTITTTVAEVEADTLPFTGFETGKALLVALLVLAIGAVMLSAARRRDDAASTDSGGWSSD